MHGLVPLLHRTHLLYRLNSATEEGSYSYLIIRGIKTAFWGLGRVVVPAVWEGQLSWFGQIMKAVHAREGLAHGLAVKASAVKVGQLLPIVLLILIWVIVVGAHDII